MTNNKTHTLEDMRNLGPKTAQRLRDLGVQTPEDLKKRGAVDAYCLLKHNFPDTTNTLALMALAGALLDEDWRKVPKELLDSMKREVWDRNRQFMQKSE